jgi:hypothetical protein
VKEQKKYTWFHINITGVSYCIFSILIGEWLYLTVDVVSEVVHPVAHPLAVPALHQLIRRYVHLTNSDINYAMLISAVKARVPDPDL